MKKIQGFFLMVTGVDMIVILFSILGGIIDGTKGIIPEFLWFLTTTALLSGGALFITKNILGGILNKTTALLMDKTFDDFISSAALFVGLFSMTALFTAKAFSYDEYPEIAAIFLYTEIAFGIGFGILHLMTSSATEASSKKEGKKDEKKKDEKPDASDEDKVNLALLKKAKEGKDAEAELKRKGLFSREPGPAKKDEKKDEEKK